MCSQRQHGARVQPSWADLAGAAGEWSALTTTIQTPSTLLSLNNEWWQRGNEWRSLSINQAQVMIISWVFVLIINMYVNVHLHKNSGGKNPTNKRSSTFILLVVSEFYTRPLSSWSRQVSGINTINHCYHFLHSGKKQDRQIPSLAVLQLKRFTIKAPNQKKLFPKIPLISTLQCRQCPARCYTWTARPCPMPLLLLSIRNSRAHFISTVKTSMETCRRLDEIEGVHMHSRLHFVLCSAWALSMTPERMWKAGQLDGCMDW